MTNRKKLKAEIKKVLAVSREQKKQLKIEISGLSKEERAESLKKYKAEKKAAGLNRRKEIKSLPRKEKRQAKLYERIYRRQKRRPIRLSVWGAVILFLIIAVTPTLKGIHELLDVQVTTGTSESEEALANGELVAEKITDEGLVLLKNQDNLLPLTTDKINVFGLSAMNFRTGGGGSGAGDQARSVDFFQGLENAGISYNPDLYAFYANEEEIAGGEPKTGLMQILQHMFLGDDSYVEPPIDYLTDDILLSARDYSHAAAILLTSSGMESADLTADSLRLTPEQFGLISRVSEEFDDIILIVNAGNTLELGFLEDYPSIKSVLWVGIPGPRGANSIGRTLTGELNPSGRLTDTYVYDINSHPSSVNFGDFQYTNFDELAFLHYNEGLYVGYRYYETRYRNNEEEYRKTVQFPFGYGLSYTDFEWELTASRMDKETISLDINVTNRGERAGKDVVQVYFSAPYNPGGIEKAAIELAAYAKSNLLESGQSQTLNISFPVRDMSSYDMEKEQAYVLEKGTYEIMVSRNAHESVAILPYEVKETILYRQDEVTGTAYRNQLGYADGGRTYLSRSDWEGTYPDNTDLNYEAPQSLIDGYNTSVPKEEGEIPVTGVDKGIMLADLKGLDYDNPLWESYLDQFTVKEMTVLLTHGAYKSKAVERLGLPRTVLLDGPAGFNFFFKPITAASYPTAIVIGSTWNDDLAYEMGEAVGKEANAMGVQGWYAPGINIHRTPLNGRNFEYISEDPLLSGKMGARIVEGAQSRNIIVFVKHFAVYSQERHARSGLSTWANEQAIREIYLRPFEIVEKEADATGLMSSFTILGHKWVGGSPEMLQNILREEWGFDGLVSTDAVIGKYNNLNYTVRYGNELYLAPFGNKEKELQQLYEEDPVGIGRGLRDRTHTICYAVLNYTNLFDE